MFGFIFLLLLTGFVQGDGLSERDVKDLLDVERQLLLNFRNYAKELQSRLRLVKSALAEYGEQVKSVDRSPELYLANPVSSLKLLRHMSQDWAAWQRVIEAPLAADQIQMQQRLLGLTPQHERFQQAVEQLWSIVKFYNYQPGFFQQQSQHLSLSSLDCYHLGLELFEQQLYREAAAWFKVAAENFTTTPLNDLFGIPLWRIYEMQFKALFKIDMQLSAQVALSAALQLEPHNTQLQQQQQLLMTSSKGQRLKDSFKMTTDVLSELQLQCAGNARQDNSLSCNRWRNNFFERPVEDLWLDPEMMLYKRGIYDSEIRHIKLAFSSCPSSHKFEESPGISGCLIPSSYSAKMRRISERLQEMTGLEDAMDGFFVLQYGSTAAFQPLLLDTLREVNLEDVEATAIVFLNDVALGGALTIPNADLVIQPRLGDVLITYNEGNFEHIMCPNVVGNSMVIIKFMFYEDANESDNEWEGDEEEIRNF